MEWTKENTRYTYILVKNEKQKEKAIEFYESLGFVPIKTDLYQKSGSVGTEKEGIYVDYSWNPEGRKKINPFYKPRRKFPREMMVSDDEINWEKRIIAGKVKSEIPYVGMVTEIQIQSAQGITYRRCWKYAKEL